MNKKQKKSIDIKSNNGFTFVELILYIGLISIFLYAAVAMTWDLIYSREKTDTQLATAQAVRFSASRITSELRKARAINSLTESSLSLAMDEASRNPTVIDLSDGKIRLRYGPDQTCGVATACYLTPNHITITTLSFTDLSVPFQSGHVRFTITAEASGDRQEFRKILTITSSAELRNYE